MESECDGGFDKEVKQAGAAAVMGYAPQTEKYPRKNDFFRNLPVLQASNHAYP